MKLDFEGEIIWSKKVTGEGQYMVTALAMRPSGWIVTGISFKYQATLSWTKKGTNRWNTYYISLIDSTGKIEHEFNGGRTLFTPWGITEISENSWAITGTGNEGEPEGFQKGKHAATDIGILHYKYSPSDD